MAFPGVDNMGQFSTAIRNDLTEVVKFLQENHAGRYKVFNLCAEKNYSPLHFDGNVEWIPVLDHQPPTLRQIKLFCSSAKRWMLMHPENVVAVHCKGGKGRTGVMISAFLAFEGMALCAVTGKMLRFGTVEDALKLFDKRRTLNPEGPSQGVTGVSQLRYMDLFFHSLKAQFVSRKEIRVTRVLLVTIPKIDREKYFEPAMLIHSCSASQSWIAEAKGSSKTFKQISGCLYANSYVNNKMIGGSEETVEFDFLDSNVELSEDFRIELHDGRPFAKDQV
jgi:protein-tyrosine phosphatase